MSEASKAKSQSDAKRKELVKQLVALLDGGQAHATFAQAVKGFPAKLRGAVPDGLPYSGWQLLEHMRIALDDIVRFSLNPDGSYKSPKWPEGYWPKEAAPASDAAWRGSVRSARAELTKFKKLLQARDADLFAAFPWGDGQNLLRQSLLIADHTAYHVGEMIVLRRLIGAWPVENK